MLTRKRSFRNNLCVEVFSVQPVCKQSDVWVSSVDLCPEPKVLLKDVVTGTAAVGGPATGQGSPELVAQTHPVNEYEHLNQSPHNSSAPEHSIVTYTNNTCKKPNAQSFPFPNGLEMDPLAPTALVVPDFMDRIGSGLMLLRDHGKKVQKMMWKNKKIEPVKKATKTLVSIVLVEAKNIPNGLANGSNGLYCKFKLGTESHKSKQVQQAKPSWCEKFNMHLYNDGNLEITMWHKGKQKLFMGRCIVDLSKLSKDRSHDLWQDLGCGHGSIHIVVTMNSTTDYALYDHIPTNAQRHEEPVKEKYSWYKLNDSWDEVGELTITVMGARSLCPPGLIKADAYCVVELDNARVQTHTVWGSQEPYWNKTYVFPIYDITSALEISVFDDSLIRPLLGQLTLPLLRINNDEDRWYALKDKSNKSVARGNLAKIQLKMTLNWNPIKASIRVLSPKQEKYAEKTEKFNIPLIYYNLKFIREIFNFIQDVHEKYKLMLEWDDPKMNMLGLMVWLVFWFSFRQWMTPLLLVIPFIYHAVLHHHSNYQSSTLLIDSEDDIEKDEKTLKTKILGLQDLTLKIKRGIDFIVTLLEKIQNLTTFEVPYLSYLAIIALLALSVAFYVLPINYILMLFGVYKFSRKFLNPDRIPNNDLLDFISRVPDNVTLSQWKELKVVESNGGGKNGR